MNDDIDHEGSFSIGNHASGASSQDKAKRLSSVEMICKKIREDHNLSPKQFFLRFLTSKEDSLVIRRKQLVSESGWPSTEKLLDAIKDLVDENKGEKAHRDWEEWILKKVIASLFECLFVMSCVLILLDLMYI